MVGRKQVKNKDNSNRPSPISHGYSDCADIDLVAPLAPATDKRVKDTWGLYLGPDRSCAVSASSNRGGDVDRANNRAIRRTRTTRLPRTSRTANRTTSTSTTSIWRARSADEYQPSTTGFTLEEVVRAYEDCRRRKRNKASALEFEQNQGQNLVSLYEDLEAGTYRPGTSICFVIVRPKPREVWAADFRDRIVHHLFYNRCRGRFQNSFIVDSCACIEDRGTLYGAERLAAKIRSVTQNWSRPAAYLKADLSNFFVSINKNILFQLLEHKIHEPFLLDLARTILFHDPRADVVLQSRAPRMALIPAHKSLFNQPDHKGLPIGNLSSQFFANIYLNELDQFVKHQLRVQHYVRYVDDFILLHHSTEQLQRWLERIQAYLPARLDMRLNDKKTIIQPIDRGVDFVGQVIKPWRRILRRRTFNDAMFRVEHMPAGKLYEAANSYFGLMRQASHSNHDRAKLANLMLRRGHAVDQRLTKIYRKPNG
jgi:RNA-directed DNA polymerase